jgi:hypothetical protein
MMRRQAMITMMTVLLGAGLGAAGTAAPALAATARSGNVVATDGGPLNVRAPAGTGSASPEPSVPRSCGTGCPTAGT